MVRRRPGTRRHRRSLCRDPIERVGVLRLALPAALTLWFLWKSRSNPMFLMGIPVLMVTGGSLFFQKMAVFWKPGRLSGAELVMCWLVVAWVFSVVRRPKVEGEPVGPFGQSRVLPEELLLVGLAALIALHTWEAFGATGDLAHAVHLASSTSFLAIGYLLVRGIACRATREETQEFLGAVVIANTIACGLYFLDQGLHLHIYTGIANITYAYAGQVISRFDVFAPALNLLALGFVLAKRRWTAGWVVVLVVTLLAILVSLTRTMVVAAAVGLVASIVARELTRPDLRRVVRRVSAIFLGGAVVVIGFSRLVPAYWAFLLKRLGEFTTAGTGGTQVQNWQVRVIHWDMTRLVVAKGDLLFGLGFLHPGTLTVNGDFVHWTSDMTWLAILYYFGYVGLAVFGLLVACFMVRALRLSLQLPELRRELALTYFVTLALMVIMTFQDWTFMDPNAYPLGLWILALVAAETLRPSEDAVIDDRVLSTAKTIEVT